LLELSRQESNDPTRTLVIWRMIKELPDSDRRAAEAILGSRG
jgi:hypothetical protein